MTLIGSITICYRPFSIEIDATFFLSEEKLDNCTYTDIY